MSSKREFNFGSRLRNANHLLAFIQSYPNYNPPNPNDTVASLSAFLQSVANNNSAETTHKQNYNDFVRQRNALHRTDPESLFKLLVPIRAYLTANYGRNSTEFLQMSKITTTMRKSKILHTKAADKITDIEISQSQQSFGAQSKFFADIIATLQRFRNYNPSKPAIQIATLQATHALSEQLSSSVIQTYHDFKQSQENRTKLYEELAIRANRIKNYIKYEYGINSLPYREVKGLAI